MQVDRRCISSPENNSPPSSTSLACLLSKRQSTGYANCDNNQTKSTAAKSSQLLCSVSEARNSLKGPCFSSIEEVRVLEQPLPEHHSVVSDKELFPWEEVCQIQVVQNGMWAPSETVSCFRDSHMSKNAQPGLMPPTDDSKRSYRVKELNRRGSGVVKKHLQASGGVLRQWATNSSCLWPVLRHLIQKPASINTSSHSVETVFSIPSEKIEATRQENEKGTQTRIQVTAANSIAESDAFCTPQLKNEDHGGAVYDCLAADDCLLISPTFSANCKSLCEQERFLPVQPADCHSLQHEDSSLGFLMGTDGCEPNCSSQNPNVFAHLKELAGANTYSDGLTSFSFRYNEPGFFTVQEADYSRCQASFAEPCVTFLRLIEVVLGEIWPFLSLCDIGRLSCTGFRCFQLCELNHLWYEVYNRDVSDSLKPWVNSLTMASDARRETELDELKSDKPEELHNIVGDDLAQPPSCSVSSALALLSNWFFIRRLSSISSAEAESHTANPFGSFSTQPPGTASPPSGPIRSTSNSLESECFISSPFGRSNDQLCETGSGPASPLLPTPYFPTTTENPTFSAQHISTAILDERRRDDSVSQLPPVSFYKLTLLEEFTLIEIQKNKVTDDRISLLKDMHAFRQELIAHVEQSQRDQSFPHLRSLLDSRPDRSAELQIVVAEIKPKTEANLRHLRRALELCNERRPLDAPKVSTHQGL